MKAFLNNSIVLLIILSSFTACKKDKQDPLQPGNSSPGLTTAQFRVVLRAGNQNIVWDSLNNVNEAGNVYSINSMNFYLSDITLKRSDGEVFQSKEVFYIDPSDSLKSVLLLDSLLYGSYVEMSFLLGIDSIRNVSFGLDNTTDNINMEWPQVMGGGYHFLKLEGHFLDSSGIMKGYAIHLGKNQNLVNITDTVLMRQQHHHESYTITLDVNEVFSHPYLYDLNTNPAYTMSDASAMTKIKINIQDAFKIVQNN